MPRAMYFATVLRCRPVRRAIAETVIPCWCSSNTTISSANLTTHRLPRPIGGEVASVPDAVPTGPTQPALGVPPTYRDVGFSVARSGENSPGDDTRFSTWAAPTRRGSHCSDLGRGPLEVQRTQVAGRPARLRDQSPSASPGEAGGGASGSVAARGSPLRPSLPAAATVT